jgi:hypothetical protein
MARKTTALIPGYEHTKADCPNLANHTDRPEIGYLDFPDWAREMNRTHRQERCPECGYYVIWQPRAEQRRGSQPHNDEGEA